MTVTFFLPILFLLFYVQVTWLSRFRPWEQKTWRTFHRFLVKKSIFRISFCIKISFDYISSEKYIYYFHNIHSVNVHNHSLARCCEDFSDLARIMWNCNVLVAMDAAIGGWMIPLRLTDRTLAHYIRCIWGWFADQHINPWQREKLILSELWSVRCF